MASVAAPTLAPRIHSFVSGFSAEDLERLRPHITASSDEIYVGKLSESNYVETFSVVKEGELMVLWYSHLDKVPEKRHSTIGVDSREECFVTAARTLLGPERVFIAICGAYNDRSFRIPELAEEVGLERCQVFSVEEEIVRACPEASASNSRQIISHPNAANILKNYFLNSAKSLEGKVRKQAPRHIQGLWNLMKVSSTPKNSFTTRIRSSVLHAVGILGVLLAACLLVNCWKSIGDVGPSHRLGVGSRLLSFHQRVRGYFSTQRKSPQEIAEITRSAAQLAFHLRLQWKALVNDRIKDTEEAARRSLRKVWDDFVREGQELLVPVPSEVVDGWMATVRVIPAEQLRIERLAQQALSTSFKALESHIRELIFTSKIHPELNLRETLSLLQNVTFSGQVVDLVPLLAHIESDELPSTILSVIKLSSIMAGECADDKRPSLNISAFGYDQLVVRVRCGTMRELASEVIAIPAGTLTSARYEARREAELVMVAWKQMVESRASAVRHSTPSP